MTVRGAKTQSWSDQSRLHPKAETACTAAKQTLLQLAPHNSVAGASRTRGPSGSRQTPAGVPRWWRREQCYGTPLQRSDRMTEHDSLV